MRGSALLSALGNRSFPCSNLVDGDTFTRLHGTISSTPLSAMDPLANRWAQSMVRLAINLLYIMIWGFAGISKLIDGQPPWFAEKFGSTFLGRFPGVTASFWLVAAAELLTFLLAVTALLRGEFLGRRGMTYLTAALVMSLLVFVQLGFGLWLTHDFNGGFQQFVYFGVTLVALHTVQATDVQLKNGVT